MVLTVTKCGVKGCKYRNKDNHDCTVNHEFDEKLRCLTFKMDMDWLNYDLKKKLGRLKSGRIDK